MRIFEYDAQIALDDRTIDGAELTVSFPHSAVMALRYAEKSPDTMKINVVTPGGKTSYIVPIIKVQQYSLDELFEKKLLFFLPFYIFSHEKELAECDSNEAKLEQLKDVYKGIRMRLDDLQQAGEIDGFMKKAIYTMINHVMALIAQKYENVRKGVEPIMGGKIIEYEAKTIRNAALKEERQRALAETEERAKDMIRDRMDLSLVEKYTHLSLPRIKELAHGLGML